VVIHLQEWRGKRLFFLKNVLRGERIVVNLSHCALLTTFDLSDITIQTPAHCFTDILDARVYRCLGRRIVISL
jgi:hypothetical protein